MQTMIKHLLIGCAFAAAAMAQAAPKQGVTEWKLASGKLILVTGTYQDTTTYKRSMTFYHQEKPGEDWLHVPIAEGKVDFPLTFFSISSGETTVADAVVVARGEAVQLVVARRALDKSGIGVVRYQFSEMGPDNPDGPAYWFKQVSSTLVPKSKTMSVDDVLKKEAAQGPTK